MVWVLLGSRLRAIWNSVWKVNWKYRLLGGLAGFGMGVFFIGVFAVGRGIFGTLATQPVWGAVVTEVILFFAFAGILLFFFISTSASAASSLFLSKDLEFLFALPIKPRTIFAAKLVEALALAFAFVPFMFLPFLVAFGIGYKAPFYYYPAMLLILISLLIWGACFGLVIASVLVRVLPARRANETITAVAGLVAVAFAFSFQLLDARLGDRPSSEWAKMENWQPLIARGRELMAGPLSYLPSGWAKGALLWASGQSSGGGYFWLLVLSAAALFAAVVYSAEKIYERGWILASPKVKKKAVKLETVVGVSDEKLFSPFWGVVKKDWRILRRDFNQLLPALILPLVLVAVPFFMSLRAKNGAGLEKILPYITVGLAGIAGLQNGLRIVPWEGLAMGPVLALPLKKKDFVSAKLFFSGVMTAAELWAATAILGIVFRLNIQAYVLAACFSTCIAASSTAVGVWVGTVFARWDWTKPNQMITVGGVFAQVGVIYLFGGLWAGLLGVGFLAQRFLPFWVFLGLGSIIYGAVSFFLVWLFGVLTVKRLERLEWKFG